MDLFAKCSVFRECLILTELLNHVPGIIPGLQPSLAEPFPALNFSDVLDGTETMFK